MNGNNVYQKKGKSIYDAILIPLGGLDKNGRPHEWVIRRLKEGAALSKKKIPLILLGRGTVNKPPPLDRFSFPVDEAVAAGDYLVEEGFPKNKIFTERVSLDTIGNAYFAKIIFTDPMSFKKIAIITSDHHMLRVKAIFEWIFSLHPQLVHYHLSFISVSDDNLDKKLIQMRIAKEKKSLQEIKRLRRVIRNLRDFHSWLFSRHGAYAYSVKPRKLKGKIIASY